MKRYFEAWVGATRSGSRLFRTLRDIPLHQHAHRICFELRSKSLQRVPNDWRERLARLLTPAMEPRRYEDAVGPMRSTSLQTRTRPSRVRAVAPAREAAVSGGQSLRYRFSFLGTELDALLPFDWNPPDVDRLWRFHLHYFGDLRTMIARERVPGADDPEEGEHWLALMEDWVRANPFGAFDAWHPYPTSLRVANWTYALRTTASLRTRTIEQSLWRQFNYLTWNKEYFAGGNHLLENLRALIVAGTYFEGLRSRSIVHSSANELASQLRRQILPSGLHFERSTTYHLAVLQLVLECALALRAADCGDVTALDDALAAMHDAAMAFRLDNGSYPLANDAAFDLGPALDPVLKAVRAYFGDHTACGGSIHFSEWLVNASRHRAPARPLLGYVEPTPHIDLDGYHVIRSPRGIELWFDTSPTCPPELPAHGHADTLNVDVYWKGTPVIVETGTSRYQGGAIRDHERSTRAHNTVTVNEVDQSEVWGAFRIGRKARPTDVRAGADARSTWATGGHDGYLSTAAVTHHRWVGLIGENTVIVDRLAARQRQAQLVGRFHLGPAVTVKSLVGSRFLLTTDSGPLLLEWLSEPLLHHVSATDSGSWYAPRYGERTPRGVLIWRKTLAPNATVTTALAISAGTLEPTITFGSDACSFTVCIDDVAPVRHTW